MTLPDFREPGPLSALDQHRVIPNNRWGAFPGLRGKPRAFVLFRTGRRVDLLNPRADSWTDQDLAQLPACTDNFWAASRWSDR